MPGAELTEAEIQRTFILSALRERPHDEDELVIILQWLHRTRIYSTIADLVIAGMLAVEVVDGEVTFAAITPDPPFSR